MSTFCFILGNNPLLSLAEILNLANYYKLDFQVVDVTSEILIIETEGLNAGQWQSRLGGTVKISKLIKQFSSINELVNYLTPDNLQREILNHDTNKIVFGFSLYGRKLKNQKKKFKALGLRIKKDLQSNKYKSRFIEAKNGSLSAVQIEKNKIINNGADILIIGGIHALYVSKTLTIQDFETYSRQDYGRPKRDAKSGLLPPKLAKILINLSQAQHDQQLLDPFCGSGTIIQEALLMGYKNITGSDISKKAIQDTKKNINWLSKQRNLSATKIKLLLADVKTINKKIKPSSVDTIVTEPYLGPPVKQNICAKEILATIKELENLYLAAFKAFAIILKPNTKVVIIFPLFKTRCGIFLLKILESLETIGFSRLNPIPEKMSLFAKVGPTARGSLIYQRPDQKVQREIFIFQYKKAET